MKTWTVALEEVDHLIRNGKIDHAKQVLQFQKNSHTSFDSQQQATQYIQILRRLGLVHQAMGSLRRLDSSWKTDPGLLLEEAGVLMDAGLNLAAERKLSELSAKLPQALMQMGMLKVAQWDFRQAHDFFSRAVKRMDPNSYSWRVGKVNQLNTGIHVLSNEEWRHLAEDVKKQNLEPLLGHWVDLLSAQHSFFQGRMEEAHDHLTRAKREGRLGLVVEKWQAILEIAKNRTRLTKRPELVLKLQKQALESEAFEIIRDTELWMGLLCQSKEQVQRVISHTRHPQFLVHAQRLARRLGLEIVLDPQQWILEKGPSDSKVPVVLGQPVRWLNNSSSKSLLTHQESLLLVALARDSYAPLSLIAAFESVYPDEDYDDTKSHERIRKLFTRLKTRLENLKSGLEFERTSHHRIRVVTDKSHWSFYRRLAA